LRRVLFAALAAAVLLTTAPAWAHEEIDPKTLSTGTPTFFTLSAANEKKVDLTKVVLTAPSGVPLGEAIHQPPGWTASKTDTAVTWTGGKVAPGEFDQWGFETDGADQPGQFTFTVTLGFADNSSEPVKVPVTVVAAESATPAVTPTTGQATVTTAGSATTPSTAATAAPASTTGKSNSASGKATAALILGAVALVLGLVALALAARRRPAAASGKTADW